MADTKLDVRVYPIDEPKSNTMAFANVSFNDTVAIRGIRVINDKKGLSVSMPQSLDKKTNKSYDIAFPLNGDLRKAINEAVLKEYDQKASLAPDQRGYEKPEMKSANSIKSEDIKLDIRVYPIPDPQGSTKAFASVSVDDIIAIRGIRVINSEEKGMFVTMPQSKDKENKYHDTAFPIISGLREKITAKILDNYKAVEKTNEKSLANGLRAGAERAAENNAAPRESASKSSKLGVLE